MDFDWTVIVQIATIVLGLVGGVYSVRLVNYLKVAFGLKGMQVQVLTWTVSVVLAVLTLVVSGQVSPTALTPEYVVALAGLVLAASQQQYNRIKGNDSIENAAIEPLPELDE